MYKTPMTKAAMKKMKERKEPKGHEKKEKCPMCGK